jgi:hypothetical protein
MNGDKVSLGIGNIVLYDTLPLGVWNKRFCLLLMMELK